MTCSARNVVVMKLQGLGPAPATTSLGWEVERGASRGPVGTCVAMVLHGGRHNGSRGRKPPELSPNQVEMNEIASFFLSARSKHAAYLILFDASPSVYACTCTVRVCVSAQAERLESQA